MREEDKLRTRRPLPKRRVDIAAIDKNCADILYAAWCKAVQQ